MSDSPPGPPDGTPESASVRAELTPKRAFDLAHGLNNVFTPITGYATLIREALAPGAPALDAAQMLADIDVILRASRRGTELTNELMQLAVPPVKASQP